jgi:hypothetical protein
MQRLLLTLVLLLLKKNKNFIYAGGEGDFLKKVTLSPCTPTPFKNTFEKKRWRIYVIAVDILWKSDGEVTINRYTPISLLFRSILRPS